MAYTHEQFGSDVAQKFEFLESSHGLRRHALHAESAGAWIIYENADVKVTVEYEIGGSCGVSVQNVRHVNRDPLERNEFDLDEIVALSGGKPRREEPRSMPEAVSRAAQLLQSAGSSVLKGDFVALHARQARAAETIRRNNAAMDLTLETVKPE